MNRTFKTAVVAPILAAAFAGSVAAGPFEDGLNAVAREDYATAIRLWGTLADQGNVRAQVALAILYATGHGVPQDYVLAYMWLNLAAAQGELPWTDAQDNKMHVSRDRDNVAAQMTPDQIAEAQRLAREWKPVGPGGWSAPR